MKSCECLSVALVVFDEASEAGRSSEESLDDPASRQEDEAMLGLRQFAVSGDRPRNVANRPMSRKWLRCVSWSKRRRSISSTRRWRNGLAATTGVRMVMAGLFSWNPNALPASRNAQPARNARYITSTVPRTPLPRGFVFPP